MPIYEYRCEQCQKIHEVMQKFSDAPLETCPDCESPVQKQMSLSSFALKGTGWYATDYKKRPVAPVSPSSASAPSATGASGSASEAPVAAGSSASGAPATQAPAPAASTPGTAPAKP